jgi:RNA recognition motif-containing protein
MKNIFISNLSFRLKNEDLQRAFEEYGEVSSSKIITDKYTGRSRGFGFVEMSDDSSADKAIEELNGAEFDGKIISVAEAKPKSERPAGERRSGGFNRGGNSGGRGRNDGGGYNRSRY